MSNDKVPPFVQMLMGKPPTPEEEVSSEKKRLGRISAAMPHYQAARESLLEAICICNAEPARKALRFVSQMLDELEIETRRGPQI